MYTVIHEYKEGYTNWLEFGDKSKAIIMAIKCNLTGSKARVFEGTGDNVLGRVFPVRAKRKH